LLAISFNKLHGRSGLFRPAPLQTCCKMQQVCSGVGDTSTVPVSGMCTGSRAVATANMAGYCTGTRAGYHATDVHCFTEFTDASMSPKMMLA